MARRQRLATPFHAAMLEETLEVAIVHRFPVKHFRTPPAVYGPKTNFLLPSALSGRI